MTTESTEAALKELFAEVGELKTAVGKLTTAQETAPLPPDWEWATSAQLAAWLGLDHVRCLYWLRSTSQAPRGHRVGKEIRYRRRDVEQWLTTRAEP